jgi:homoserine O-acetyltransferase/O-succinyltransferase
MGSIRTSTTDDFLASSDSSRSGSRLEHLQSVTFEIPLDLELGGSLPTVTVAYETYGRLNSSKDNGVLVCHAISGDSHVARHDEQDSPGWWDIVVGPGKAIDTDQFFVICPNVLGGCRGTTGPNTINPESGRPYGPDFPTITVRDMVELQRRLLDHLGIDVLRAVIGGSMGGHQVLTWATAYPQRVRGAVAIASSARLTAQALAFDVVGRNAILRDPNFQGGEYYDSGSGPSVGLAIARMIGHITYVSREAMREKFEADRLRPRNVPTDFEKKFSVGSYLGYQGDKFVERFDANSYVTLSMAMDLLDLGPTREDLVQRFRPTTCRWLVISYTSDWLFPPDQSRDIVNALIAANKPVTYCNVRSSCGHDAFLLADDLDRYGELIRAFLSNLNGHAPFDDVAEEDPYGASPTSIFQPRRLDYDRIIDLIDPRASVLDLGCGQGGLLTRLKRRGNNRIMGVELDERSVVTCVQRGLSVIQADLDEGLSQFGDGQFDVVVLSQALQAVKNVQGIVDHMLRVGRQCIVSFPNMGYHKLRKMLSEQGRAPKAGGLLRFEWYNSPNIRFLSIADFDDFCAIKGIRIHRRIALSTEHGMEVTDDPNYNADLAIFVISR